MSNANKGLSARFATWIAAKAGSTAAFMLALSVIEAKVRHERKHARRHSR